MDTKSSPDLFICGESIAARHLQANSYKVIAKNFRSPYGEIDIIAEKGDTLVFVEVKCRKSHSMRAALDAVSFTKQKRISLTAQYYINQNPLPSNCITRFDVIIVFYFESTDTFQVHHFEDAFIPFTG